jgi:RNA polymerase sigma-B factor
VPSDRVEEGDAAHAAAATRQPGGRLTAAERDAKVLAHLPLVRSLARRYANRGEPLEDLVQVGVIGLIKAIDRFDASRGLELSTFATPTILGEIRRHFRDRGWAMHVPRGIQEAHGRVSRVIDELTGRLGRSPSVSEIAVETGFSTEEVLEAMAAGAAYQPLSLSRPPSGADDDDPIEVGVTDVGFEQAAGRAALGDSMKRLPARERVILHLRFERGMTQSEIGARLGISQMHVSRLIQRALETLRRETGAAPSDA